MSEAATSGTSRHYDGGVVGAGPVGEKFAERTRAVGLDTIMVESELIGGECSYRACEPSKALLRPAWRAPAPGVSQPSLPGPMHFAQLIPLGGDGKPG